MLNSIRTIEMEKKMKRVLVIVLISLIFFTLLPNTIFAALPEIEENERAYVIEGNSKSTIVNKESENEINLGDLTDLIVAKITFDTLQGKLSDSIQLTKDDIKSLQSDETGIFVEGQTLTYQDLLNILLLTSNDNASKLLGINIGKKLSDNGNVENTEALKLFVEKLNETSKDLKLSKTRFSDVTGEKNTTTAKDLTIISQTVLSDNNITSIINSDNYELKMNSPQEEPNQEINEDQEMTQTDSNNSQIINVENRNIEFLSIINSIQETESEDSEEVQEDSIEHSETNLDKQTEESTSETQDNKDQIVKSEESKDNSDSSETSNEIQKVSFILNQRINEINKINTSGSTNTRVTGYLSKTNSDNVCGVFLTEIDNAQIIGAISDISNTVIGNQINSIISELNSNYGFVDLSNNEALTSKYSLVNTHFSSPKTLSLSGIESLNAYMPITDSKPKTKIIWDEDYIKPIGENYQLIQSIEPLTQIATLEIKNGEQTQSIPLYNTDKVTIRNLTDTLLKYGLILFITVLILLIIWRLIYVHNRRKVLRRQRLRRLKRQRQLRARQLAVQQGKNQNR